MDTSNHHSGFTCDDAGNTTNDATHQHGHPERSRGIAAQSLRTTFIDTCNLQPLSRLSRGWTFSSDILPPTNTVIPSEVEGSRHNRSGGWPWINLDWVDYLHAERTSL